jgi:tricorn protease-like protein
MKKTSILSVVLVGLAILGAGCNSGCGRKQNIFKEDDASQNLATDNQTEPGDMQTSSSPITIDREPTSLSEAPTKFVFKKDGTTIKEITTSKSSPFTMRIFKQTDNFVYVAGYREGLGGYILFEADPITLYRVDLKTNEVIDLTRKDMIVEDIYGDNMIAWADPVNKVITVTYPADSSPARFSVPKKYGQFGNIRFSPDGKKIAYAAAIGNVDKEQGAVFVANIETGKQNLVIETTEENKYYEVNGWKDNNTVDFVDRGVTEK